MRISDWSSEVGSSYLLVAWIVVLFWIDRTTAPSETNIAAVTPANATDGDWLNYGNDQGGSRYAPLTQLTAANVAGLEPVWTYHPGPSPEGSPASFQATPLNIGERLYFCTG